MAFLAIELDEVMIHVQEKSQRVIHPVHLSPESLFTHSEAEEVPNRNFLVSKDYTVFIINPQKLAQLITIALTEHSGLIIFTSEPWSRSILHQIAEQLPLSRAIKQQFTDSYFFNRNDKLACLDDLEYKTSSYHSLLKCDWLTSIIANYQEVEYQFANQRYVIFDHDIRQQNCSCFASNANVVIATPETEDEEFYDEVLIKLDQQKSKEYSLLCQARREEAQARQQRHETRLAFLAEASVPQSKADILSKYIKPRVRVTTLPAVESVKPLVIESMILPNALVKRETFDGKLSEASAIEAAKEQKPYRIFRKPVEPRVPEQSKIEQERQLREFAPRPNVWRP